jgi:hypothetical protein
MVDILADTEGEIVFVVDVVLPHPDINTKVPFISDDVAYVHSKVFKHGENREAWEIQWCLEDDRRFRLAHKIYSFIKDFGMDVEIFKENN